MPSLRQSISSPGNSDSYPVPAPQTHSVRPVATWRYGEPRQPDGRVVPASRAAASLSATFALLGDPITFANALLIEAAVQLVRTLAFVVPAGLGAQEAAMLLAAEAIVGAPATGVAAAVVRRGRELVWIASTLVMATICAVSRHKL